MGASYDQKTEKICFSFNFWLQNYAHIEVLVTFLLVNFFGFSVITRTPLLGFGRNLVEMNPTSPPDLSKQPRTLKNDEKTPKIEKENLRKREKT